MDLLRNASGLGCPNDILRDVAGDSQGGVQGRHDPKGEGPPPLPAKRRKPVYDRTLERSRYGRDASAVPLKPRSVLELAADVGLPFKDGKVG